MVHATAMLNMAKSKTRLKILIISNLFLCQQSLKLVAIFFHQFSCFHIAEAHLDVIFPQKLHFDDVTLAIVTEK